MSTRTRSTVKTDSTQKKTYLQVRSPRSSRSKLSAQQTPKADKSTLNEQKPSLKLLHRHEALPDPLRHSSPYAIPSKEQMRKLKPLIVRSTNCVEQQKKQMSSKERAFAVLRNRHQKDLERLHHMNMQQTQTIRWLFQHKKESADDEVVYQQHCIGSLANNLLHRFMQNSQIKAAEDTEQRIKSFLFAPFASQSLNEILSQMQREFEQSKSNLKWQMIRDEAAVKALWR